jgi:hypothetical protein
MAAMVDLALFPSAARRNIPRIFLLGKIDRKRRVLLDFDSSACQFFLSQEFFFEAKK